MRTLALSRSWPLTLLVLTLSLMPLGTNLVRACTFLP